jgi:hypothetical protein
MHLQGPGTASLLGGCCVILLQGDPHSWSIASPGLAGRPAGGAGSEAAWPAACHGQHPAHFASAVEARLVSRIGTQRAVPGRQECCWLAQLASQTCRRLLNRAAAQPLATSFHDIPLASSRPLSARRGSWSPECPPSRLRLGTWACMPEVALIPSHLLPPCFSSQRYTSAPVCVADPRWHPHPPRLWPMRRLIAALHAGLATPKTFPAYKCTLPVSSGTFPLCTVLLTSLAKLVWIGHGAGALFLLAVRKRQVLLKPCISRQVRELPGGCRHLDIVDMGLKLSTLTSSTCLAM